MTRRVAVGVDGSASSVAAVSRAAREAMLRAIPLLLVHVEETPADLERSPDSARAQGDRTESLPRDAADAARSRHPSLEVTTDTAQGRAADALTAAANQGCWGHGDSADIRLGHVAQAAIHHSGAPVAVVPHQ